MIWPKLIKNKKGDRDEEKKESSEEILFEAQGKGS